MIEVLAPTGSSETLIAAVRAGCDAVYLGAKSFSARRNATNFDNDELKETVIYCHQRNVKVYVTVNILIKESEFDDAIKLVDYLNDISVDGLIVQDLGLAKVIHECYPDLPLHGSTQMSIQDINALDLLKEYGYKRIVIAREMNKHLIEKFCQRAKELDIEVEMFVHGALCMSVSGQCLMSAMLGCRSGNRGLCGQACRLPFKVENGNGHDLSLKDLSLFKYVDELKQLGIASLKIEGRMKRPEYVAMATKCCRDAVDGKTYNDQLLKDIFSRSGFTDGYYQGRLNKENFGVRTIEDVQASMDAFNKIHEIYRGERQSIGLDLNVEIKENQPIKIYCKDICLTGEIAQIASNKPTSKQEIIDALSKMGNTPYFVNQCNVDMADNLFVRMSCLNNLRRQLVELLNQKACEIKIKEKKEYVGKNIDKVHQLKDIYLRFYKLNQIPDDLDGIKGIIIPIDVEYPQVDCEVIIEIDRWINDDDYFERRLAYFKEKGVKKLYCNNLAAISLARKLDFEVMGGNYLNIFNSEAINRLNLKQTTLSVELSLNEIAQVKSKTEKGIISYGRIALMLLMNCPLKNGRDCSKCDHQGFIVDRLDVKFPIRCHLGVSELLNSAPIYMADRQDEMIGLDYQILYFTIEEKKEVEKIIEAYKNHSKILSDYTRGLYYRSVL